MPATGVLRQAIGGQRRLVAQATLLLVTHQAAEALVPVAAGAVIDAAVATGDAGGAAALDRAARRPVRGPLERLPPRRAARRGEAAAEYAAHDLRLAVARRILDPRGGADAGRVGALGWARALPDGLDTPVGDGGHRLTQAAAADRIVVLGAGRVVKAGAHDELVGAGGRYAALWAGWSAARPG